MIAWTVTTASPWTSRRPSLHSAAIACEAPSPTLLPPRTQPSVDSKRAAIWRVASGLSTAPLLPPPPRARCPAPSRRVLRPPPSRLSPLPLLFAPLLDPLAAPLESEGNLPPPAGGLPHEAGRPSPDDILDAVGGSLLLQSVKSLKSLQALT